MYGTLRDMNPLAYLLWSLLFAAAFIGVVGAWFGLFPPDTVAQLERMVGR